MKKAVCLVLFASFFVSCNKLKDYFPNPHKPKPMPEFNNVFGGTGYDIATDAAAGPDGGYIMVGSTSSNDGDVTGNHGADDAWFVKLAKNGNKEWQKAYGGSNIDYFTSAAVSPDGGYILAGYTDSNDGDVSDNKGGNDAWVVKVDNSGNMLWQKTIGGSADDRAYFILPTTDGSYIMVGSTSSNDGDVTGNHGAQDVWVVKLDNSGNLAWQKTFGGSRIDEAHAILGSADGGYVMAGLTSSSNGDVSGKHGRVGTFDAWVVKFGNDGTIVWQKALGGSGFDAAVSIINSTDDGYVIAGSTSSNNGDVTGNHGDRDAWVVKLENDGTIIWQKALGGSGVDIATSVVANLDGGYTMAGYTSSHNGDVNGNHSTGLFYDAWVVKLNNSGAIVWQKALGGSIDDNAISILTRLDGSYVVAGFTSSNDGDVSGNHGNNDFWLLTIQDN